VIFHSYVSLPEGNHQLIVYYLGFNHRPSGNDESTKYLLHTWWRTSHESEVGWFTLTLWETNIAIENGPFIVDLPIENGGSFQFVKRLPEGNHPGIPNSKLGILSL